MHVDHIVLWVSDQRRSLAFYVDVLGLEPLRAEAFERSEVRFPSVRLNETTIFDLIDRESLLAVRQFTGGGEVGGSPLNHVCVSMSASEYALLVERLRDHGVETRPGGESIFGAQGSAVESQYLDDPDGNVLEIRYYESA